MSLFNFHSLLSTVTFLLTLLFISFALTAKKPAGSTMAWLLVILVAPYIGIPLYIMLSGRKLPTRLAQKKSLYDPNDRDFVNDDLTGIQKLFAASGIPAAKLNQSITLLPNGEVAYATFLKMIREAKRSIHITTFIFGNDSVGKALVAALAERAASGLEVRVIVDSFGAVVLRHPSLLNFSKSKGQLAYFMPIFHLPFRGRANLRNHRKLLIVDGELAIVGGMNLAIEYMGPTPDEQRWTDMAVQIFGPSVSDLEDIFIQDWNFATKKAEGGEDDQTTPEVQAANTPMGPLAQVVASGPDVDDDPLYDVLLSSIFLAKSEVTIVTPYFIPDETLAKALELAAKRGVRVRVLLPRKSNHRLADIARGSFVRQLLKSGATFHFYSRMIHAKAVMIDDAVAFVGSANFDMRSLLLNYELGIFIYDQETLQVIRQWIEQHLQSTISEFSKDNFPRRILEGIGRVIGPFI